MVSTLLARSPLKHLGYNAFRRITHAETSLEGSTQEEPGAYEANSSPETDREEIKASEPLNLKKLENIAEAAVQLASLGPKLATLAAEMEKQAQAQARRATAIADTMETLTSDLETAVSELRSSSGQVGEALTTVSRIADHTRIISLNASIEAARAGQHGRAFAVVVEEVQRLADRTGETTHTIESRMGDMKSSIVRVARVAGDKSIEERQDTGVGAVNHEVHGMAHSAKEQLGGSQSLHKLSEHVLGLAEELLLSVGSFRFEAHEHAEKEVERILPSLVEQARSRSGTEHLLENWLKQHAYFELAYITDAKGRQCIDNIESRNGNVSHDRSCFGKDWSERPWYKEAISLNSIHSTDIYRSSATGDFCFTVAVALRDQAGTVLGVLGADVNFQNLLQRYSLGK
jgi:hypothetical protein